jgi:hypothetical protein
MIVLDETVISEERHLTLPPLLECEKTALPLTIIKESQVFLVDHYFYCFLLAFSKH